MHGFGPSRFHLGRLLAILVMLCAFAPSLTARAAPAASPTVSNFYTSTATAYDAWNADTASDTPPLKTTSFPAGTKSIAFYYEYDGATAGSTGFTLVVKNGDSTVITDGPLVTKYTSGLRMHLVDAPNKTFPGGAYTANLLLKGQLVATTSFTVAGTGASTTAKATASIFYTSTKAAYDTWNTSTSTARPAKTAAFASGTSVIAFYFEYDKATPKVTQYRLVIHSPSGAVYAQRGPYAVSYQDGMIMRTVLPDKDSAYPSGTYTADLLLDGRTLLHTTFTIGGQASVGVTIGTLYPATKAAYDAWLASATAPDPAKTTAFPAGTKTVTFYFQYKNAKPKTTEYTIVVKNQAGKAVISHGPYVTQYKDGLQMSPVTGPGGAWPSGAYRADLTIDGHVMFSTFFSVGPKTAATPACTSNDKIATCIEPSVLRLHANLANSMQAEGTGFVILSDATGTYLLTNKHVVEGATVKNMSAWSPDGKTPYEVVGIAQNSADTGTAGDLAVVKLVPSALKALTWDDSESLRILQHVISIGYGDAFDLPGPPTVTEGSISALHRDLTDGFGPVWIQHQSFINHGNSGGPLLDDKYKVVGVNTISFKDTQGMFFAIPSNLAKDVAAKLIAKLQS